jgi:hypothetical protein
MRFFKPHLDDMKIMIAFLRDNGDRLILRRKLELQGSNLSELLEHGPACVFKLRWGTIAIASKDLDEMHPAITAAFDRKDFRASEGEHVARLGKVAMIMRTNFFEKNAITLRFAGLVEV